MSGPLLRLAWRNLWHNPGRTLIAMAAIGLGYAMLLFVACLMAGLRQQMIESGTDLGLSDIEVHAPGYYPDRPLQQTLGGRNGTDVSALVAAIAADPRVQAASPRVYAYGLVSATHQSAGVQLLGVVPEQERKITVLQARMAKGSYLSAQTPKGVVLGDKLATTLGVDIGSEIVLLTSAADGSMGNDLYTVAGIFHTGLDAMDQGLVLMPLASLQELLRLSAGRIHEVGIKLHDITAAATTAAALEVRLSKILPVRVMAWQELAPELADYVQFNRRVTFILFVIFFLLAAMGIINTMLMAIIERTRELGMLMAVGMRPVQVVGLIVAEAASLAAASLVLGAALGAPLLWYLQVHGLNLGSKGNAVSLAGIVVGPLWYGRQDFPVYIQAALGLAITALLSALYPALRAARFRAGGGTPKGLAMMGVLLLVKIGWRNLWRNPRGTLLTALALGLGLTLLLVSLGLLDGGHEQMIANAVRFGTGHVVVQPRGYQDTGSQSLLLPSEVVSAAEAFLRTDAMKHVVRGVSPRLLGSGLLSSAANADGVRLMGVIPKPERTVSLIPQRIVEGSYLNDDQRPDVVIGVELARKLAVKIGAKVVLMTQMVQQPDTEAVGAGGGEMQSTQLRVSGIFRTGVQAIDAHVIQIPLAEAQVLLGAPDQVTQVAVLLEREGDLLMVAQGLRKQLTGVPVEILPWREAMPALAQLFLLDDAFNYVMNAVVLAVVGLGILNTILMRVLERRYEFGLLSALGLRPVQLAVMVIGESLALTSFSLALGLVLGLSVQHYLATHGLDLRWFFKSSLPAALVFDPIIYARLSPTRIASSVWIVFLTATVISLYPALKAARTKLPDALKVF